MNYPKINKKKGSKKGFVFSLQTIIVIFVVVFGAVFLANWLMGMGGKSDKSELSIQKNSQQSGQVNQGQGIQPNQPIVPVSLVEDVTVTFSSWDSYSRTTNAGTGHRIISAGDNLKGGDVNLQVNDDATRTYSPGQSYRVLLGNLTETISCTGYYPTLEEGIFPDKGTFSVSNGQYGVACPNQLTFTFFDETDTATTTAQAITAGSKTTVAWQIKAPDNECVGNLDTAGVDLATYWYNSTTFSKVVQLKSDGTDEPIRATPNSATRNITVARQGIDKVSYDYPIICDNKLQKTQVRLETVTGTAGDADGNQDINITLTDISYDFNTDTLDIINSYVDENNNDLGFLDATVGSLIVS